MMLLPAGRSNSDVLPLQTKTAKPTTAQKPQLLTRTSSPQLTINSSTNTTNNKKENGYAATGTGLAKTPPPTTTTSTTATAGNQCETGTDCDRISTAYPTFLGNNALVTASAMTVLGNAGNWAEIDRQLAIIQSKLKEGWTVHLGKEGRLYYCNHLTHTSGWLPSLEDWSKNEEMPYGWERAIDSKGRSYYINHLNKTSTYESPDCVRWDENPPEPRVTILQRSPTMGFGFVAGSEKPVIVRFVTEGGPSVNKLQPGDQILAVNGEDVKEAPRDRVIQLVRACETHVTLLVCQPAHNFVPGRKSTLLSAGKRAKLRSRPSRVRFAESVCVNGAPLFPASAFSLGDICVPPMANVLKVFLENGQTKSFKYDATTTVRDVMTSLLDKLCLTAGEIFSLVLEHVKSLKRNKLTLLDPEESLARIAARPGAHKLRCLFRVTFVPISAAELAQRDLNALDYLFMQCCNDVNQERFAPELQPEMALRLAALHMHQHALANKIAPAKLTVKVVEREFGLERFVPISLFDGMKRKEVRRLISHFLKLNAEMTGSSTKVLTQLQAKLHYLDIVASLPSYGAKCFSTNQREGVERVLLVSPRFGLSQISNIRNSIPQPITTIEDMVHVVVNREDDVTCSVCIFIGIDRVVKFSMEDRDAVEFSLVLAGYYKLLTAKELPMDREREQFDEDNAPSYLAQHTVLPAAWSYLPPFHNRAHSVNFLMSPPYHPIKLRPQLQQQQSTNAGLENGSAAKDIGFNQQQQLQQQQQQQPQIQQQLCDRNMNSAHVVNSNHKHTKLPLLNAATMDLDIHSVMATELLEEAKDSGMSDSSGGGSNYCERQPLSATVLSNNAFIEAKNQEVFRRVQEMQKMVENSEQYLNEQGEYVPEYATTTMPHQTRKTFISGNSSVGGVGVVDMNTWQHNHGILLADAGTLGVIEFDSDCDSLNSSKVSSSEDTPQPGMLKHSDSLVLLAESINHDLSGITKGLNSIGSSHSDLGLTIPSISATSSPRPERKLNGFGQLLSNLQALGTDFSQSESDSESVNSPTSSPISRRPSLLNPNGVNGSSRKQNLSYRSSFGLHSPDSSNFGQETKDYNLKEYLKQLKEISNIDNNYQDTDVAAKKLSEIYGFEIREDTFIETDSDLIDLRAIPPPRTPDELDALSLLNAAPKGFDDGATTKKTMLTTLDVVDGDLDKFLAKVVVAPPTQKTTPAKELTPEEIMSFIIPPPPNLDEIEKIKKQQKHQQQNQNTLQKSGTIEKYAEQTECLYSNSVCATRNLFTFPTRPPLENKTNGSDVASGSTSGHVIEYATVERKNKFSCCPKSKKTDANSLYSTVTTTTTTTTNPTTTTTATNEDLTKKFDLKPPPRSPLTDRVPPARPPKSIELLKRYSPKKQPIIATTIRTPELIGENSIATPPTRSTAVEGRPPILPPRPSITMRSGSITNSDESKINSGLTSPTVSIAPPKKPPIPPIATRPILRAMHSAPFTVVNGTATTATTKTKTTSLATSLSTSSAASSPTKSNARTIPLAISIPTTNNTPFSNNTNINTTNNSTNITTITNNTNITTNGHHRSNSDCPPVCLKNPPADKRPQLSLLCSPQMARKNNSCNASPTTVHNYGYGTKTLSHTHSLGEKFIIKNGHVIDAGALLTKTDIAMAGLLVKLDQIAAQCSAAQSAGGGTSIDEEKFQRARNELTEQTLVLVTASKFLVVAMSDMTLSTLPEHLTSCLTAIRRITELTQDMTRHTSSPLQTRNIVLKVHDVASSFREVVSVEIGPLGAGQLALQAECLANVLATLLRSLRVFSP